MKPTTLSPTMPLLDEDNPLLHSGQGGARLLQFAVVSDPGMARVAQPGERPRMVILGGLQTGLNYTFQV